MMRARIVGLALLASACLMSAAAFADDDFDRDRDHDNDRPLTFAAFGDWPYASFC